MCVVQRQGKSHVSLAKKRSIRLAGEEVARTPMLVPSFSSKGFSEVQKIAELSAEFIDGPALVSAYDVHYKKISPPFNFPSLIFLDSGGYEASKDLDLSDLGDAVEYKPQTWTREMYESVVDSWESLQPTIFISYDHHKDRLPFLDQVKRAKDLAPKRQPALLEILIKPETIDQRFVQVENVLKNVRKLDDFAVIGVTEKEIGNSIAERMKNIARIRRALDAAGLETPIHVFGSLDTVTTPLYFLAGADIFDGLTWLRFAYFSGLTVYKHNFSALHLGMDAKEYQINGRCWTNNYYYLQKMELEMKRYLLTHDMSAFGFHSKEFAAAFDILHEALEA